MSAVVSVEGAVAPDTGNPDDTLNLTVSVDEETLALSVGGGHTLDALPVGATLSPPTAEWMFVYDDGTPAQSLTVDGATAQIRLRRTVVLSDVRAPRHLVPPGASVGNAIVHDAARADGGAPETGVMVAGTRRVGHCHVTLVRPTALREWLTQPTAGPEERRATFRFHQPGGDGATAAAAFHVTGDDLATEEDVTTLRLAPDTTTNTP